MKHQFVALNVELPNGAPEWVELIPAGPNVQGVDGRSWYSGPEQVRAVLAAFADRGLPYPIDWEHSTEYRAPKGEEAPAAAWIVELADRQGALWGRVEWTPRARQQVENREYRYLSPVFAYTKTDRKIQALLSAGLTNTPNLRLTALNRNQARNMEDDDMKKALCRLLGLPETATDQDIEAAVAELKGDTGRAANRALPEGLPEALGLAAGATPEQALAKISEMAKAAKAANTAGTTRSADPETAVDLGRYVPRPDYDQAMNRAQTAEQKLADIEAKAIGEDIERSVNQAMAEGKIAPASREFYVAMCRKDGGLDEFKKFAASAPKVIANPVLPDAPADKGGSLSDADRAVCRSLGIAEGEYTKSLKAENPNEGGA